MQEVAIVGAGELGGLVAHVLARRDVVRSIRLIDEHGSIAAGKALDLMQAAPLEGFSTQIGGSADLYAAAGAEVIVIADPAGAGEWFSEDGVTLLRRLGSFARHAIIVCAGASQRELVERAVQDGGTARQRIVGSAPEALTVAARAMVGLDRNLSPRDVSLSVFGIPPNQIVIAWENGSIGGVALTRLLSEPSRRRLTERIAALWPVGPYALASAAVKVIEIVGGRSGQLATCFVAPDESQGTRTRTAALPVRLGPTGIIEVVLPELSTSTRVALENATMI